MFLFVRDMHLLTFFSYRMEYFLAMQGRRLVVEWNGTDFGMHRSNVFHRNSRPLHVKMYLYLPKMPISHTLCLVRRLKRKINACVGQGNTAMRSLNTRIRNVGLTDGLHVRDEALLPLMEQLGLDDIVTDVDLIGYYQRRVRSQLKSVFVFGFNPDDLEHYLAHSMIRGGLLNYGRNGDLSL